MKTVYRKFIDWRKTGKNLQLLRNDNGNLRREACRINNLHKSDCSGECESCKYDMDSNISRKELAVLFGVSDNVIYSWENGRTPIGLEDLLFYCQISKVKLEDIIVFTE
ncbi:MAG: helix-turn-helix domain-containing protein [Clostridia bacterium]|nr:helix-turn-helix domain-containing protein [Clostridia bacterium]